METHIDLSDILPIPNGFNEEQMPTDETDTGFIKAAAWKMIRPSKEPPQVCKSELRGEFPSMDGQKHG